MMKRRFADIEWLKKDRWDVGEGSPTVGSRTALLTSLSLHTGPALPSAAMQY